MKSNMSVAIFAVYLFGLIVSLNSSPMVPSSDETSGNNQGTNLPPLIKNYLVNVVLPSGGGISRDNQGTILPVSIRNFLKRLLSNVNENELPEDVLEWINGPDFLKELNDVKDETALNCSWNVQLDSEFIGQLIFTRNFICEIVKNHPINLSELIDSAREYIILFTKSKLRTGHHAITKELVDTFIKDVLNDY
ncbi:uncharacterized protein LOC126847728 [Adelges cooleyi]|uniref:uncharacterized protein LOC126847728 n=1 Tax=Adelges cooleyi TaxID=133065 RepID=UPI0021804777|nr:uncharacterized protein LOC126847728 [Adelges cooleyi]